MQLCPPLKLDFLPLFSSKPHLLQNVLMPKYILSLVIERMGKHAILVDISRVNKEEHVTKFETVRLNFYLTKLNRTVQKECTVCMYSMYNMISRLLQSIYVQWKRSNKG